MSAATGSPRRAERTTPARSASRCSGGFWKEAARLDLLNEPEPNDWVGHGLVDALGAIEAARRAMPVDRPATR